MNGERKDVRSEQTKDMTQEQLEELQARTAGMAREELQAFRGSFDPDSMGFCGEESV